MLHQKTTPLGPANHSLYRTWLVGLLAWGLLVTMLALSGLLTNLPTPLLPLPIALALTGLLAAYIFLPSVRRPLQQLDMRWLTLFNVWRVPAALLFFWYGAQGLLPATFVRNAGWGDLIAGVATVPVVLWLMPQPGWRRPSLLAFHLFSFADFLVAVGTGFRFSLLGDPLMSALTTFPLALIPLFGVPLTGALSVIALHRLATGRE